MADVKNSNAGANRHVLGDNAATDRGWVFDGHIPAVEFHHLRSHLAMDGVQRGLADDRCGFDFRQEEPQLESLKCRSERVRLPQSGTVKLTSGREERQMC